MEKNNQRFLELIMDRKDVTMKEAVQELDKCFQEVAMELGVSIRQVIKDFYALLNPGYGSICRELDANECEGSNYCTYYENLCIPIFVKDYEVINTDPDMYLKNLDTGTLTALRNLAAHLYYNVGDSGLLDNSFDAIEWHLRKRLMKEYKKTEAIGALPIDKLRVDLPYAMPSLDKIKPEQREFADFLKNAPGKGIIWSEKLDGVSGLVIYNGGKAINLYTRGDGLVGGDISYLLDYIEFPTIEYREMLVVRGELVVRRSVFREKYKDLYSTGRSFVVAQTNRSYITNMVSDIDFVAYEVVDYGTGGTLDINPQKDLAFLSVIGFNVVIHGNFPKDVLMIDVTLVYKARYEQSEYDIDGLVLNYNFSRRVADRSINPEYTKAFKMQLEEQLRTTVITGIDWDISRYGRYVPTAEYRPVYIDGVRLARATAHNSAHVRDWSLGVGTVIEIARSGQVIPQIKNVQVSYDIDPIFPPDTFQWHWKGCDIILNEIDTNPRVNQKRILHFLEVIQVFGIGLKTVEKLFDNGISTIKKLLNASPDDLVKIKGVGKVTSKKIKDNLSQAMVNTPIDRFLAALTVTDFRISRKLIKDVFRTFPDIIDTDRTPKEIEVILKRQKIRGIGPKRFQMLADELPRFRRMLMELDRNNIEKAMENQRKRIEEQKRKGYNPRIQNKVFVFTGFMKTNYDLEDDIYSNYGEVSTSVTSDTAGVIVYSNTLITPKVLAAKAYNIPIYTVQEFRERILN